MFLWHSGWDTEFYESVNQVRLNGSTLEIRVVILSLFHCYSFLWTFIVPNSRRQTSVKQTKPTHRTTFLEENLLAFKRQNFANFFTHFLPSKSNLVAYFLSTLKKTTFSFTTIHAFLQNSRLF
jgi:hypothetical protein